MDQLNSLEISPLTLRKYQILEGSASIPFLMRKACASAEFRLNKIKNAKKYEKIKPASERQSKKQILTIILKYGNDLRQIHQIKSSVIFCWFRSGQEKNMSPIEIQSEIMDINQSRFSSALEKRVEKLQESKEEKDLKQVRLQLAKTTQKLIKLTEQNQRLQQKFAQLMNQCELQNQRNLDKFVEMEPLMKPIRYAQKLHSLAQPYRNHFTVDLFRLQFTGKDWVQYIFNSPINHNQSARFKIKIIQTLDSNIIIGVLDYAKQKDERSSYSSNNAMCYYGYNGIKYPNADPEGKGFKQGDVVEVDVNRATKTIKYSFSGSVKATHANNMLADSSRIFMPFVEMYQTNDIVEWVVEK